jgi:hypothetical protein
MNNIISFNDFITESGFFSKERKVARLIPYIYTPSIYSNRFGSSDELVYVDSENKHPDPKNIMLWGWNEKGETVSDFKKYFKRSGRIVEIPYYVPTKGITANQEKKIKIDTILRWINSPEEEIA